MFCISFAENDFALCLEIIRRFPFVEIRLDKGLFSKEQIQKAIALNPNLILTPHTEVIEPNLESILLSGIASGVAYIDLDIGLDKKVIESIIKSVKHKKTKIILSYHNYQITPQLDELIRIIELCGSFDPDIIKIVCTSNSESDNENLISIYHQNNNKYYTDGQLIAFCIGEIGKPTRLKALKLGAPFMYVSYQSGKETADGQMDIETMSKLMEDADIGN